MIRIRNILDPDLRKRVSEKLAQNRGLATVPDWFELDDADYVDLLNQIHEEDHPHNEADDPRD